MLTRAQRAQSYDSNYGNKQIEIKNTKNISGNKSSSSCATSRYPITKESTHKICLRQSNCQDAFQKYEFYRFGK